MNRVYYRALGHKKFTTSNLIYEVKSYTENNLHTVLVKAADFSHWTKEAVDLPYFVKIKEDGNGAKVSLVRLHQKRRTIYLDYCELHDLLLALSIFHKNGGSTGFKII